MLNKEQCMKALFELSEYAEKGREYHGARGQSVDTYVDERVTLLSDIICDYFSNPPLKFEELKEGMWVWDNKHKVYNQIYRLYGNFMSTKHNAVQFKHLNETTQWGDTIEFEKTRFYRKEVV